ncbi:uncharacterized protein LOC111569018 [Amphiprion ocellaris]|uniref:uncharacterized protein LOC111569018 n=1 Tax=Amphiprion ocellaris TaxID=80972 RepID=UPI002410BA69|nr:uncharacterized protein LOC111569018 [Amphiprion ocellaris]
MDLITAFIISAVLFVSVGSEATTFGPDTRDNASTTSMSPTVPAADTASPTSYSSSPEPVLGLLTVSWTTDCKGIISLILHLPSHSSSLPVCHSQKNKMETILQHVCQSKTGCYGVPRFYNGFRMEGYDITEKGSTRKVDCETLVVTCKEVEMIPDVRGELKAYKVVTGLLCCVLLILLLIRFTRPTIKALQRRFSDRRQNRWVGPTQSHSVSYHRGKTTVKNNDGDKRLSYPALELLTISGSREF